MLDRINNMFTDPEIPRLYVAQRVIDKMASAAQEYIEDETGEAMIGLVIEDQDNGVKSIYILDTIAPGDGVVRELHTFQQGSEWQDDILNWLRENWQVARKKRVSSYGNATASKWDSSLYHVGDWHKQPGYMIQPSVMDWQTAREWIHQAGNQLGFLVAPILTIDHPATVDDPEDTSNFVRVEQPNGLMTRIDFWYIARKMRSFYPITPNIVSDSMFPRLMAYPWHLLNEARAYKEMKLLEDDGMLVEVLLWDTDEELPLEVCFLTARSGASHFLLICTPYNYPVGVPDIYTLPFNSIQPDEDLYDLLGRIWTHAELVEDPEGWEWSPEKTLLEYVYLAEETLGWDHDHLPGVTDAGTVEQGEEVVVVDTIEEVTDSSESPSKDHITETNEEKTE